MPVEKREECSKRSITSFYERKRQEMRIIKGEKYIQWLEEVP